MRWIILEDGTFYTLATDIQNKAKSLGYKAPSDFDGTRHPGTDCNAKARTILNSVAMRSSFDLKADGSDVIELYEEENVEIIEGLREHGFVNSASRHGNIQLYSPNMARAILSKMVGQGVELSSKEQEMYFVSGTPNKRIHSLAKMRTKPMLSLFGRENTRGKGKMI